MPESIASCKASAVRQPNTLIQIVPGLSPTIDGIGDYALQLARQLRLRCNTTTSFIVCNPSWPKKLWLNEFSASGLERRSQSQLVKAVRLMTSHDGVDTPILLHFSPYGYEKRGCPLWLVRALEAIDKETPGRINVAFHELDVQSDRFLSSAYWVPRFQRSLIRRLLKLKGYRYTNTVVHQVKLEAWCPECVDVIPNFANIGEPSEPPLRKRARDLVIFGRADQRRWTYEYGHDALASVCRHLSISRIIDVGASIRGHTCNEIHGVPVVRRGQLAADEVADTMRSALASFLYYPIPLLTKSGVHALSCASGTLSFVFDDKSGSSLCPGLTADLDYIAVDASSSLPAVSTLESLSLAIYTSYCKRSSGVAASCIAASLFSSLQMPPDEAASSVGESSANFDVSVLSEPLLGASAAGTGDVTSRAFMKQKRVAIVHDWLTEPGGAERVLRQMLISYPDADLFSVVDFLKPKHRHLLDGRVPRTSFIQKLPFARRRHWWYLALMPIAIEQFDLSKYDLIISSSYCVAKGVLTGPEQVHLSYVHTPIRYAWHLQHQYLREMRMTKGLKSICVRVVLHYMRMWDLRSAVNVDKVLANSSYVGHQVSRMYRQDFAVLPPPVELERFALETEKEDYYVTASRMVPYKRVDLIVSTFARMPHLRLLVVGDGPEMKRVRKVAEGHTNIEILGYQPDEELKRLISRAKAFVFAAIEDFGISPVEAQAAGTPVICLGRGGSLETIQPMDSEDPTGVYFFEQTEESLMEAVKQFEAGGDRIKATSCRRNAERFAAERFRSGLKRLVDEALTKQLEPQSRTAVHVLHAVPNLTVPSEAERAAG